MTGHLTDEALLRVLEGEAEKSLQEHAKGCASCGARVREAEEGLALAHAASEVPEPPPQYWEAFRRQVGERIAAAPEVRAGWRRYLGWGSLVPAAAAVALLLVVLPGRNVLAPPPAPGTAVTLPAWEALPASADDAGLVVLEGLALGGSDLDEAAGCRSVADCLESLSDEESQAVVLELRNLMETRS